MTAKRLSPERLAEIRDGDLLDGNTVRPEWVRASYVLHLLTQRAQLLGHIEAVEADLAAERVMVDAARANLDSSSKELVEARAELSSLRVCGSCGDMMLNGQQTEMLDKLVEPWRAKLAEAAEARCREHLSAWARLNADFNSAVSTMEKAVRSEDLSWCANWLVVFKKVVEER